MFFRLVENEQLEYSLGSAMTEEQNRQPPPDTDSACIVFIVITSWLLVLYRPVHVLFFASTVGVKPLS